MNINLDQTVTIRSLLQTSHYLCDQVPPGTMPEYLRGIVELIIDSIDDESVTQDDKEEVARLILGYL